MIGHFHGYSAGHALNNQLLRALFASQSNWRWTAIGDHETAMGRRERISLAQVLRAS